MFLEELPATATWRPPTSSTPEECMVAMGMVGYPERPSAD